LAKIFRPSNLGENQMDHFTSNVNVEETEANKTGELLEASKNLQYFEYLNELRESGTINMMGAPREMQHEFGLDKIEARKIFQLWTEQL
jgi:hypothetical protein|tara:strand:- start:107 stop:373 length:267 start_codon:yes stop_codon:yes gene_type:complete